jgi:hypothetical protein
MYGLISEMSDNQLDGIYCRCLKPPNSPVVLYLDDNGWWVLLSHLYFSRKSSRLWLVSRHPEGISEEIIGRYCPQCFSRYTAEEANLNQNRCLSCFQCPRCLSSLTAVAISERLCALQCGYCYWRSDSSGLCASDKKELESLCLERERELLSATDSAFSELLTNYKSTPGAILDASKTLSDNKISRKTRWGLEDLHQHLDSTRRVSEYVKRPSELDRVLALRFGLGPDFDSKNSLLDVSQKIQHLPYQCAGRNPLPPRITLRSKRTLRCKQDVHQGRMNIVVQPKPGPLEGDSSQKTLKGNWWVKDGSAIHEIPR